METKEGGNIVEWRIENFSHWCGEVHGKCIESPKFCGTYSVDYSMELYPKGISGGDEHLGVRFSGIVTTVFPDDLGDLSFYSSNGSLLSSEQPMNAEKAETVLGIHPGPRFAYVLSRIRESEDFITVRYRMKHQDNHYEQRIGTTINAFKISLKINLSWFENRKPYESKTVFSIQLCPDNHLKRMRLDTCSKNNVVEFTITPITYNEDPFAVEMCITSSKKSDDTVASCVKEEYVFRDISPWTVPYTPNKKELTEKEISLFLCLKTKHLILSPYYINYDYRNASIESNNTLICFSEKQPSAVDMLSNDLMRLYQDQDFSDFQLKCDNVSFPVHKVFLSARSPVFRTMLSTDMTEAASGCMDIVDLDPSTLSSFLSYLYTGVVDYDSALKLYYAADKYQVLSLKRECSDFLCSNVSISNVCDVLSLADRHQDDRLTSAAHSFISRDYDKVMESKEWEIFVAGEPLLAEKTVTHFESV